MLVVWIIAMLPMMIVWWIIWLLPGIDSETASVILNPLVFITIWYIFRFLQKWYLFWKGRYMFYGRGNSILFGSPIKDNITILKRNLELFYWLPILRNLFKVDYLSEPQDEQKVDLSDLNWQEVVGLLYIIGIICGPAFMLFHFIAMDGGIDDSFLFGWILLLALSIPLLMSYVIGIIMQYFSPLSRFANIGIDLQNCVEKVEIWCKNIIISLRGDIDFRIVHSSFDTIAKNLSRSYKLSKKLEQIELEYNVGNIFDSAKFLESLKSDIRSSATELILFLNEKKISLTSGKALNRNQQKENSLVGHLILLDRRTDIVISQIDTGISCIQELLKKLE